MDNENTYSLKDLLDLLLGHLALIILVTLLGGAAAFSISKFMLPVKYSSHISMYVQSYKDISESVNNINNISNSKQLVNTYIEVLKDDAVMTEVGSMLKESFDRSVLEASFKYDEEDKLMPASIRNCLSITSVTDTSALKVTATTQNAELSAALCNDLTQAAPEYVEKAVGVGSINTIDKAKVYDTPVSPNKKKNTAIGMFAGFALIAMIIFLIDFFDNTIRETDAIGKKYKKAIIGEIQEFGEDNKKRKKKKGQSSSGGARGLLTDPNVPFSVVESYKSIRTNILFTIANAEKKVFAVSSANPGEGKSTTAANIAITLAQTNSKVLLIDADMRKPVMHKTFHVKNADGLSTLIIRKSKREQSIKSNVYENLDLLPSGPMPPNPSELLASEQFRKLLGELSEHYDYIVLDTPPINVVSDAMVMQDAISGILLIYRYARTTYEELADCMKQIKLANANVLGFVMNYVHRAHSAAYYNYKYKYKYKYGYGKYGYSSYGYGYYGRKPETENSGEETAETDTKTETKAETGSISRNDKKSASKNAKGKKEK